MKGEMTKFNCYLKSDWQTDRYQIIVEDEKRQESEPKILCFRF